MNILVLNCGSSSLKFQLFAVGDSGGPTASPKQLARGMVDRIGGQAILSFQAGTGPARKSTAPLRDHRAAIEVIINWASSAESGIEGISPALRTFMLSDIVSFMAANNSSNQC